MVNIHSFQYLLILPLLQRWYCWYWVKMSDMWCNWMRHSLLMHDKWMHCSYLARREVGRHPKQRRWSNWYTTNMIVLQGTAKWCLQYKKLPHNCLWRHLINWHNKLEGIGAQSHNNLIIWTWFTHIIHNKEVETRKHTLLVIDIQYWYVSMNILYQLADSF